MKTGIILWLILEKIGLDEQVILVIVIAVYIAFIILVIGFIVSIFNTAQYTKKLTEQNKQIIKELQMIRIASVETTNLNYEQLDNQYSEKNLSYKQEYNENNQNEIYNDQQQ